VHGPAGGRLQWSAVPRYGVPWPPSDSIDDFRAVAAKQGRSPRCQSPNNFGQTQRRLADHLPRHLRFHAIELVVHRRDGNAELAFLRLIGVVDGFAVARGHEGQQVHDRGEQKLAGMLTFCGLGKDLVQQIRRNGVFQCAAKHDTHRTLFDKPVKNFTEQHCVTLLRNRVNLKPGNTLSMMSQTFTKMLATTA